MSLKATTVVILGGSSGIGLATAKAARAEGAQVYITGRSPERLDKARAEAGDVRTAVLDAADEAGTQAFFQGLPDVDHVFITAGTVTRDLHLAPGSEAMRPAMDMSFWRALFAAKYAAPKMRGSGSITFLAGKVGSRSIAGASVASASCGAVNAFARALAVDLAPIRVNTIQPGFVDTPLLAEVLGPQRADVLNATAARLPVGRVGKPEDIADAVLFLMKN